jgi:zinc-ribbon domain
MKGTSAGRTMSANNFDTLDSTVNDEEPAGAERYLNPGENLRICSSDIQIKKIRFESYLTNKRLFLIDQNDRKSGITAKEIPIQTIVTCILEESPSREPVLVLSVTTSDDDVRTMKLVFMHTGEDRGREAEEWVHLIEQTASAAIPGLIQVQEPATAPEVRPLTDTMILPASRTSPPTSGPARAQSPGKPSADQASAPGAAGTSPSSTPLIAYCFHCGKKLPEKANFCPFCGTRVHETVHEEVSHLHLPLHQYRDQPETPDQDITKKRGWRRFFGK